MPEVGSAVIAKFSDPDGEITGATWQWYRGGPRVVDDPTTEDTDEARAIC